MLLDLEISQIVPLYLLTLESIYCTVCEEYITEACSKSNCPWALFN